VCVYTNDRLSYDPVIQFTVTGTVKLLELQNQCQNLQNKIQTEHYQKQKLERDLQVIQRQITELTDSEKLHQQNFYTLQSDTDHHYNEKCQIDCFKPIHTKNVRI
jgi:hypothetical protein